MRSLRQLPIHRALFRPNLFMGGERRLVMTILIFTGIVIMSNTASLWTWGIASTLLGISLYGLRKLAKRDPLFPDVYKRQLRYQPYYPPNRGVDAPQPRSRLG